PATAPGRTCTSWCSATSAWRWNRSPSTSPSRWTACPTSPSAASNNTGKLPDSRRCLRLAPLAPSGGIQLSARLTILLLCLLGALHGVAAPLTLTDETPVVRPAPWLEYLLPEGEMDAAQAAAADGWRTLAGESLSLGYQPHPVWVRLLLHNESSHADWRLLIEWPILDRIELRLFDPASASWSQPLAAGDHLPLSAWPEPGRQPLFPL